MCAPSAANSWRTGRARAQRMSMEIAAHGGSALRAPLLVRWAAAAAFVALAVRGRVRGSCLWTNEVKQLRAEVHGASAARIGRRARAGDRASVEVASDRGAGAHRCSGARISNEKRLADQQATLAALQKIRARQRAGLRHAAQGTRNRRRVQRSRMAARAEPDLEHRLCTGQYFEQQVKGTL